ncbi:MAG: NAD(P)-dependent alcohol dehydrogenase [Fimbriimonadaceae bacterium]|nr:NAD(P)-dependent alcohol dehydrogenase [Fimbriimonadaceae bacterium]
MSKFRVGDEVIVYTGARLGCHTALKAISQDGAVIVKPASLSFQEAAALASSGTTALAFLKRGGIRKGSKVLIVGASGAVGSAAVMLAKHLGAHVTAVCRSKNVEFVASLGADRVIDSTKADFRQSGETYDAILDTSGTLSYLRAKASLKDRGVLLLVSATLPDMVQAALAAFTSRHKVVAGPAPWTHDDLRDLAQVVESGAYRVPIDRTYPIEQMAEAHAYVDTGRKTGNVVISMGAAS